MSNKGEAWRKFVQTFFLAEQPNGYFVLNDIFRFLKEESVEDEEGSEAAPEPEPTPAPAPAPVDLHVPEPVVAAPVTTTMEPAPSEPAVESDYVEASQPRTNGIH